MKALFLLGPTASGKTAVAMHLAARFPVEIVSVDSAQVYRGMDVGTAKPTAQMRARVPHHLIDVVDPTESYSAGRFREDALRVAREIHGRGRVPLFAGGTMLYFRALTEGLADLPRAANLMVAVRFHRSVSRSMVDANGRGFGPTGNAELEREFLFRCTLDFDPHATVPARHRTRM